MSEMTGPKVHTPAGDAPVVPVVLLGTGMYLCWFAIHYWASDVKWPTDPIKAVLQGKPAPDQSATVPQSAELAADISSFQGGGPAASGEAAGSGDTGVASQSAQHNQDIAKLLTVPYGWSPAQNDGEWNDLVRLWNQESGWSNTVQNQSSGAFGVAQALGHGKGQGTAGKYGNNYSAEYGLTTAEAKSANDGDPTSQIKWGLGYIAAAYGDPHRAWQQELAAGSY